MRCADEGMILSDAMTDITETLLPADRCPDGLVVSYSATHLTVEPVNYDTGDSCGTFTLSRRVKPSVWRAQNELQAQANAAALKANELSKRVEVEQKRAVETGVEPAESVMHEIIAALSELGVSAFERAEQFAKSVWGDQWPALTEALDDAIEGTEWTAACSFLGRIRVEVTAHEGEEAEVPLDSSSPSTNSSTETNP